MKQQMALFKQEIKEDVHKTVQAATAIAAGAGIALIGAVLFSLMLVYLIQWLAPAMALWLCYLIVGAVLAAVGGALIYAGKRKFASFNPLPDQSVQAVKETVQWITKPK